MSALEEPAFGDPNQPTLYIACPLTGLAEHKRRSVKADVTIVRHAVESVTVGDRIDGEVWPIGIYAPIDHTAPWTEDGLSSVEVYERNLSAIHDADGLVVVAEDGGSAGVGQELEWAVQLRIPVLYLTASKTPSRQIQGSPAFLSARSYNGDPVTLEDHVRNFLRQWKPLIVGNPLRRESRRLRFDAVTVRLRNAWIRCSNPTDLAAQARVDIRYLELALSDPRYTAAMPTDTLITLAHLLGVPLAGLDPSPSFVLPVQLLRPLMAAAAEDGWADAVVERMLIEGRAAVVRGDAVRLETIDGWRSLQQEVEE